MEVKRLKNGELTTAEIRKLIKAHNVAESIKIPKGATRQDILQVLEKAGYVVEHKKAELRPVSKNKVKKLKIIDQKKVKEAKPKPKTELQKQKDMERKQNKELVEKKKVREIKKQAIQQQKEIKKKDKDMKKKDMKKKGREIGTQTEQDIVDKALSLHSKGSTKKPNKKKEPTKKEPSLRKYPKSIWFSIENSLASYQDVDPLDRSGGEYSDKELKEFSKTAKELEKNERWKLPFSKLSSLQVSILVCIFLFK